MKKSFIIMFSLLMLTINSYAGGVIVAGGKTHTAILVDEDLLGPDISVEIHKKLESFLDERPVFDRYESVTDDNGKKFMCASFGSSVVGSKPFEILKEIATNAGAPSAIRTGACRFDIIN